MEAAISTTNHAERLCRVNRKDVWTTWTNQHYAANVSTVFGGTCATSSNPQNICADQLRFWWLAAVHLNDLHWGLDSFDSFDSLGSHWSLVGFLGLSPIAVTALPQLQLQLHRFPNRSTVACWPELLGGLTWVWLGHNMAEQPSLSTQMSQFLRLSKQLWHILTPYMPNLPKLVKVNGRLFKRSFLAVAEHRLDSFFLKRLLREVAQITVRMPNASWAVFIFKFRIAAVSWHSWDALVGTVSWEHPTMMLHFQDLSHYHQILSWGRCWSGHASTMQLRNHLLIHSLKLTSNLTGSPNHQHHCLTQSPTHPQTQLNSPQLTSSHLTHLLTY